jgi:hypothetical protein
VALPNAVGVGAMAHNVIVLAVVFESG